MHVPDHKSVATNQTPCTNVGYVISIRKLFGGGYDGKKLAIRTSAPDVFIHFLRLGENKVRVWIEGRLKAGKTGPSKDTSTVKLRPALYINI